MAPESDDVTSHVDDCAKPPRSLYQVPDGAALQAVHPTEPPRHVSPLPFFSLLAAQPISADDGFFQNKQDSVQMQFVRQ